LVRRLQRAAHNKNTRIFFMSNMDFNVTRSVPEAQEYCQLRIDAGLSAKPLENAKLGLKNSLFGVCIRNADGTLIAMGRLVGDGGCFVQICDIAVNPKHQGKGLGRRVMEELMAIIADELPKGVWLNLFADGTANQLYQKFGFQETAPASIGMALYT
jgi:ribosomal protein S18 acetylase RimI-like enzyme